MSDRSQHIFLFDIDGTLLKGSTAVHRDAFRYAFQHVYGVDASLDEISAAGRTDTWLLAEPLRRRGLDDTAIWEGMGEAFRSMEDYVDEHLGDLRGNVLPGVPALLAALHDQGYVLGLLTGNLRRVALAKLRHAGLASYLTPAASARSRSSAAVWFRWRSPKQLRKRGER
jgi:phosphoglycolate phosphatase-like HAD superfamily hydrolase